NEPLEILAEGGVVYAALFGIGLVVYFVTVIPAWVTRRDPLMKGLGWGCLMGVAAVFLFSLLEFPLRMPANALTCSVILSLGWVSVHHRTNSVAMDGPYPVSGPSMTRRLIPIVAILGMCVSGLTAAASVLDRAGDSFVKQAQAASGETQPSLLNKAEPLYHRAQAIEPWQPAHAFKLGQVFEMTASSLPPISVAAKAAWASATASYREALRLHPANARIQAALAWAALQSGDLNLARRAAHAALRLAPGDPNVRFAVSKWYLVQWEELSVQDRQVAIAVIRKGVHDLPLEYVETVSRFVPDLKTMKEMLPTDLKVRRLLIGSLTERQLFVERWEEQQDNPALRILSPDRGFLVLSYGRLNGQRQPPAEATAAGAWAGMVEGWLSAGLTAT
ncbi:MAG: O-antigen ligase family protein, partial [Nitrospiraceae bacterium]